MFDNVEEAGRYRIYQGVAGVNDGDILIETTDVSKFDVFFLSHGAGSCIVEIHDGLQWLTAPLAMADLGTTALNPVLQTAALRLYGWRGRCKKLRVKQSGVTAVTNSVLRVFES